ncbi:MAG: hypothetical protein AAF974_00655, partial [Cyanobacteria bacterium P01_E01_bin.34]
MLATQSISQSRTMSDGSNVRRWLCSVTDVCEASSCQLSISRQTNACADSGRRKRSPYGGRSQQ